jgi:hypothetical protein
MSDKMQSLKLYGRQICFLTLIVFGISCGTAPKPDDLKIAETKRLWQTIPIYSGMSETGNNTAPADSPLVITKTYKSDAEFADVQKFYVERLAPAGWQFVGASEVKHKGRIRGERLLEFTQGSHRLIIQFAGQLRADLGWDYAIELAPSDYWKEMVF